MVTQSSNHCAKPPSKPLTAPGARALFPRGLAQPEGSFRFSSDALLLASFPASGQADRVLDLGTGCGVVGLGLLCRFPTITVTGVDCQSDLVAAATRNAARLGFGQQYNAAHADLAAADALFTDSGAAYSLNRGVFDLVVANPPYRQRHRGRLPQSEARLTALFETDATQNLFCRAAGLALRPGGRFAVIYPAARERELVDALSRHGLAPCRVMPLLPKRSRPPALLLMESVKTPADLSLIWEKSLTIHDEDGAFSAEALAFCPFLAKGRRPLEPRKWHHAP